MALNFSYVDVNPFFSLNTLPDLVYNVDAINSSIGNILGITHGERWYYPQFGSDIRRFVWAPLDDVTANLIYHNTVLALARWEPRIQLLPPTAVIANQNFQRFDVNIYYSIIENQIMGQFTAYVRVGGTTNDLITGPSPAPMVARNTVILDPQTGQVVRDEDGNPIYSNA